MPAHKYSENLCILFLPFQHFFTILNKGQMCLQNTKREPQGPQKSTFLYETFTRPLRDLYETFTRPCAGVDPYLTLI